MHYFGSKAELFGAVIQDRFASFVAGEEALLASHRGSYRDLLHQLVHRFWEHLWKPGAIELALVVKAERSEFPECARTLSQLGGRWRRLIEGVLEAGQQQGEFRISGPHVARVIGAMVWGVAEANRCLGTVEAHPSTPEELWTALVALLDHGVVAAQGDRSDLAQTSHSPGWPPWPQRRATRATPPHRLRHPPKSACSR